MGFFSSSQQRIDSPLAIGFRHLKSILSKMIKKQSTRNTAAFLFWTYFSLKGKCQSVLYSVIINNHSSICPTWIRTNFPINKSMNYECSFQKGCETWTFYVTGIFPFSVVNWALSVVWTKSKGPGSLPIRDVYFFNFGVCIRIVT